MAAPASDSARERQWRVHAVVLGSYALLSLLLTAPLVFHFGTHVPGDGIDDPALTWNLWWVWDSLRQGRHLFQCDFMFHPIGINLAFYTLTVLNGALSGPLQEVAGLIPASNTILLSSYILSGYGAFLLCYRVLPLGARSTRLYGAWFAGLVYAFAAPKLFYAALGQFNVASSQWIPFAALALVEASRGRRRMALIAALFLALQAWAEMTYASFLIVFASLLFVWRLAEALHQRRQWRSFVDRTVVPLALAGVAFALLIAPLLAAMIPDMLAEGDFSVVGGGFADVFSADLAGLLAPTMLHPLLGNLVGRWTSVLHFDKGQHLYFGLMVWLLAALGWARTRRPRTLLWVLSGAAFLALSLGPVLQVNGKQIALPMPFQAFQELPFFKANRYPSRYGVMAGLSLAVLSGMGVARLVRGRHRTVALALVSAVFLLENLSVPLPLSDMRVPPLYRVLADDKRDSAVLDLPLAWRNGFRVTGAQDVAIMFGQFYQTEHGKRLLGGNTSRNPEFKFQYFSEMPVLQSIVALERGHPLTDAVKAADRQVAPEILSSLGVTHVVVRAPPVDEALQRYVEEVLPTRLLAEEGGMRLYAVETEQTPGNVPLAVALAEGWGMRRSPAVAVRETARLMVPGGDAGRLSLEMRGFATDTVVAVSSAGAKLGECGLATDWTTCVVEIPASTAPANVLELTAEYGHEPTALAAIRTIGTTGATAPLDIYVRAAGEEFGDFGHIYVAGVDAAPNERGYNLVVIDPSDGRVIAAASFDTHADPDASAAMAAFVGDLPPGAIVAGAAADEASLSLSEGAVSALRALGVAGDLRGCFRCAHAFVGLVGAPPGTAAEELRQISVAEALVGRGVTEPRAYFELAEVAVER